METEIHLTTEGKHNILHLAKNEESQREYILLVSSGWAEELIAVNKRKNGEIHLTTEGKQDISHLAKKPEESQREYILLVCNGWAEELIPVGE